MAFCPNPDCPHKKSIGRPAEFQDGITRCSDCGSILSEEAAEETTTRKVTPSNLCKRILFTLGLIAVWRILVQIPLPGINVQSLESFFRESDFGSFFSTNTGLGRVSVFGSGF